MKINATNTNTNAKGLLSTVQDPLLREWVAAVLHLAQLTADLAGRSLENAPADAGAYRQETSAPCPPARQKLAYSLDEAIEALSIGRTHLFDLLRRGEIASVKVGRRRLVLAESLDAYLARLIAEQSGA